MPSEKSRYLERNRGPEAPVEFMELKKHLSLFGTDRMAEILWIRAQYDDVLAKSLMGCAGILLSNGDWEKAKTAIDYALHFPDYVRYTDGGHGQILEEIKTTLEDLTKQNQREFALRIGQYVIERGHEISENFEDDWDWTSSLSNLKEWVHEMKERM